MGCLSVLLWLPCKSSLYSLDISPSSDIWFENIFLPFYGLSFYFLDNALDCTKGFNFNEVQFIFYFLVCAFGIVSKKSALFKVTKILSYIFFWNFIILAIIWSVILYWGLSDNFLFCILWSNFTFPHPIPVLICSKGYSLPIELCLHLC